MREVKAERELDEKRIEMTANRHIKDALHYLMTVQEIANRPYMIDKVVDIPTIREHAHKAVIELLAADAILAGTEEDKCAYRHFLSEDEYMTSFPDGTVPPFLCFQPFVIHDGVAGYMVPCKSDHPMAEEDL